MKNEIEIPNDADGPFSEQINYELYSQDKEQEIVHCQCQAVFGRQPVPAKLDVPQLKEQMGQGKLESNSIYAAFTKMGLYRDGSLGTLLAR